MYNSGYAPCDIGDRLASETVIDPAYAWLCARRKGYSHNNVWNAIGRFHENSLSMLRSRILMGCFPEVLHNFLDKGI